MASEKDWRCLFDSLSKQDWDNAIEMVDSLVKEEPDDPTHFLKLGDFFQKKRNLEAAVCAYRKAVNLYKKQGDFEKAILTLKRILSIKPYDLDIQREITDLLVELKDIHTEMQSKPLLSDGTKPLSKEKLKEAFLSSELLPEPFRKDRVLEQLRQADVATYSTGSRIIKEGDTDKTVYIIIEGTVEVKTFVQDEEVRLAQLHAGDIFGEIAFVTLCPRTASVVALTDTTVLVLTKQRLEKMIYHEPMILKYLYDLYKSRK